MESAKGRTIPKRRPTSHRILAMRFGVTVTSTILRIDQIPSLVPWKPSHLRRGWFSGVDPFCGSGSPLVAARRAGRRYIGIGMDPIRVAVQVYALEEIIAEKLRAILQHIEKEYTRKTS
jgi:hypothetical protein